MINTASSALKAFQWLLFGAGVILISRGLMGPSTRLYKHIVPHTWDTSHIAWIAKVGVIAVAILYLALLWSARGPQPRAIAGGLAAGIGVLIAFVVNEIVKSAVAEARPCNVVLHLSNCPASGDWSFPSNHTVIAFALAAGVFVLAARWAWLALLIAVIVACARVAEGVHYPHDVVAGAALGFTIVMASVHLLTRPVGRMLEWLARFDIVNRLLTTQSNAPQTGGTAVSHAHRDDG